MLQRIREVKSDPEKYKELRERLKSVDTDEKRAEVLVDFITDNESLLTSVSSSLSRAPNPYRINNSFNTTGSGTIRVSQSVRREKELSFCACDYPAQADARG